ncbi:dendrin [Alligator mississippiensis]|uniref:dendrin n=1 Tax=Alligator mississippiensis TaxID=8496 RepID=UPI0028773D1B|nr:dendrin [Alligator mississippiensis]
MPGFQIQLGAARALASRVPGFPPQYAVWSLSHGARMDAGGQLARGCGTPWTYRSVSEEYAYLEKRFFAELPPPRPPPASGPRPLRDSTNRPAPARAPRAPAPAPAPRRPAPGADGPPSYEAHLQRRLRAGPGPRKENQPRPPPYVAPPAYEGPHRTLPSRRPRSHTLPRAWGPAPAPAPAPSHTLPRRSPAAPQPPRAPRPPRAPHPPAPGGVFVIDATRVVIRARYVPSPRRHRVRCVGPPAPAAAPRTPPAPGPAGERAARILGLPLAELDLAGPGPTRDPRPRSPARRSALHSQALRDAVRRIRRHTAPDSDTDTDTDPGGAGAARPHGALSYSSSSLDSAGSGSGPTRGARPGGAPTRGGQG